MAIAVITWIALGIVAGFVASKFVNLRGDDPLVGIVCALAGALIGGIAFSIISGRGAVAWDVWAMLCAAAGGAAGAAIYHTMRSRTISRTHQSVRRSY